MELRKILSFFGVALTASLLPGCSGSGSDEASAPAPEATEAASNPAPAIAEAPSADNIQTLDGARLANLTGNAAVGEKVFLQCKACHVREPGENRTGPSLAGIVGREAGTVKGFNYTDANRNVGITWTPEKLFQYLEKPQRVVPGTKMSFAGLPKAQDRADLIAYLQTPTE